MERSKCVLFLESFPLSPSEVALGGRFDHSEVLDDRLDLYFILELGEASVEQPVLRCLLATGTSHLLWQNLLHVQLESLEETLVYFLELSYIGRFLKIFVKLSA